MDFDAILTIKKEFTKEDFIRSLIIYLGIKDETPIDVVDARFGQVKESYKEVILCTAAVEGVCSGSIGYDRQEPYIDYEPYRERVGNSYVTRQRQVTKYRTVTDWRPFSAPYSGEATCAGYNSLEFSFGDDLITTALKTADSDSILLQGEAKVDPSGLSLVRAACEREVVWRAVSLPGDRNRDITHKSNSEILSLSCYIMPFYEVTYTYNGDSYNACCFACGDINIKAETPESNIDVTKLVRKKTRGLNVVKKITWLLFAASLILTAVLCFKFNFPWLFPLPIVLLLIAKGSSKRYSKKYEKYSDRISQNIAESKISAIKTALKKYGYRPLSKDFEDKCEGASVEGAAKLKSITGRVVLSWILVIILSVVSVFKVYSFYQHELHSPKQMEINVVGKETEYDPDVGSYINGCYYVYLEYEIEAKKTGIEYMEFKVYVNDANGNEIGYVRSNLSDMGLDKGETTTMRVKIKESKPEENELFLRLYESELSEFSFRFDIGIIKFIDGKYYNNTEYDRFR